MRVIILRRTAARADEYTGLLLYLEKQPAPANDLLKGQRATRNMMSRSDSF